MFYLEQPLLIKRGDSVVVTARTGTLTVKMPGTALMDGHRGEQISVRNKQSNRVVD
ncbi:MAG: flagellar basal body P-ring formation protein FlgA, partial [Moorea sp. SIO3C2]|nr:flagellar basal body P-ring formation protein FlgA [Moorena sp. SIO3C2]